MPLDLPALLDPAHTAVLTMELQRGVMGDLAMIPDLRDEVNAIGMLEHVGALLTAARSVGARSCTAPRSSARTARDRGPTRPCFGRARRAGA